MGLLDFKLNSSPRPELFSSPGLLLAHPWTAQPQSVPGVPNSSVSLECPTPENPRDPTPESFWGAQPQSVPGVPSPRVSHRPTPECPTPECPTPEAQPSSAQPQSVPECPAPESPWSVAGVPNRRVSLPREGGDVRGKIILCLFFLWGRGVGGAGALLCGPPQAAYTDPGMC